jgi:hypothetical protein
MAYQQQSVNKMTTSAVTAQMLGHMAPRQVSTIWQSLYVASVTEVTATKALDRSLFTHNFPLLPQLLCVHIQLLLAND